METELSNLIDTANAPIFGVDVLGKVTIWNKVCLCGHIFLCHTGQGIEASGGCTKGQTRTAGEPEWCTL